MKYVGSTLLATSILITAVANAKCGSSSTSDRFSEAEAIVFVEIISARDGSVPWPYGLKGYSPGKLLTLRVAKSWKGSLHPQDVIDGWTLARQFEHAYPSTDVGTKIIVFFRKASQHEILCCNSSYPDRLSKTSEELDAIIRAGPRTADPNDRWSGPC